MTGGSLRRCSSASILSLCIELCPLIRSPERKRSRKNHRRPGTGPWRREVKIIQESHLPLPNFVCHEGRSLGHDGWIFETLFQRLDPVVLHLNLFLYTLIRAEKGVGRIIVGQGPDLEKGN